MHDLRCVPPAQVISLEEETLYRKDKRPGRLAMRFRRLLCFATTFAIASALIGLTPAAAQKKGGTLRLYHNDTPASASLLEEATISTVAPFSAVFNNLVM